MRRLAQLARYGTCSTVFTPWRKLLHCLPDNAGRSTERVGVGVGLGVRGADRPDRERVPKISMVDVRITGPP